MRKGGSATGGIELIMRTSSLWSSNLLILVYTSCILARFRTTNLFYFLRLQPLQYGMRSSDPGSAEPLTPSGSAPGKSGPPTEVGRFVCTPEPPMRTRLGRCPNIHIFQRYVKSRSGTQLFTPLNWDREVSLMENVSTYSDVLPTNPATTHWHFDLRYVVWLSVLPSQSGLEGTFNNGLTNLC